MKHQALLFATLLFTSVAAHAGFIMVNIENDSNHLLSYEVSSTNASDWACHQQAPHTSKKLVVESNSPYVVLSNFNLDFATNMSNKAYRTFKINTQPVNHGQPQVSFRVFRNAQGFTNIDVNGA